MEIPRPATARHDRGLRAQWGRGGWSGAGLTCAAAPRTGSPRANPHNLRRAAGSSARDTAAAAMSAVEEAGKHFRVVTPGRERSERAPPCGGAGNYSHSGSPRTVRARGREEQALGTGVTLDCSPCPRGGGSTSRSSPGGRGTHGGPRYRPLSTAWHFPLHRNSSREAAAGRRRLTNLMCTSFSKISRGLSPSLSTHVLAPPRPSWLFCVPGRLFIHASMKQNCKHFFKVTVVI